MRSGANSRFATQTSRASGSTIIRANFSTVTIMPRMPRPKPTTMPNIAPPSTSSAKASGNPTKRMSAE
jgi:hypothetical protein